MFEFSTNSIIIIAVCVVAIILLLFLYLYIGRREKQASQMTGSESEPEETEEPQTVQISEAEPGKTNQFTQDEELAASVEEVLAKEKSVSVKEFAKDADSQLTQEAEIIGEAQPVLEAEKTAESEQELQAPAEPEKEAEPAQEADPEKAVELESASVPDEPVKQDGPDLSVFYQEVDEEDYEQVGVDVADAIALAFEQAIKTESTADGQSLQQTAAGREETLQFTQNAGTTRYAARQHIRGRIGNDETSVQEIRKSGEMPVGADRTTAPGSVRRRRGTSR